jgi:hypothetical protein
LKAILVTVSPMRLKSLSTPAPLRAEVFDARGNSSSVVLKEGISA